MGIVNGCMDGMNELVMALCEGKGCISFIVQLVLEDTGRARMGSSRSLNKECLHRLVLLHN
jgi:hypothetical protein